MTKMKPPQNMKGLLVSDLKWKGLYWAGLIQNNMVNYFDITNETLTSNLPFLSPSFFYFFF